MEFSRASRYYEMISVIEAQEILLDLRKHDWPEMKNSARKSWHRELHRKAYPETDQSYLSPKEAARRLSAKLGG